MTMKQLYLYLIILTLLFFGCSTSKYQILPGKYKDFTLLPNGWKLTPPTDNIPIGDLPLKLIITKNENYAFTSNSGMSENSVSVINLITMKETQRVPLNKLWRGLALNDDDSKLYVSGGNNNYIYILNFENGVLSISDSIKLGGFHDNISLTGLDIIKGKNILLAVSKETNTLYVIDLIKNAVITKTFIGYKCFDIKVNNAGTFAYVSVWENNFVAEIDLNNYKVTKLIQTGEHPCDLVITKNDERLFVTNANHNTTSVIDLKVKKEIEKLNSALKPDLPFGSTPDAVCLNKNEDRVFIANADNNYIAVFDISDKSRSKSLGFIPTGWYPTALGYTSSNKIICVNGKGITSMANPDGPNPYSKSESRSEKYIAYLLKGSISVIDYAGDNLTESSNRVYANTPINNPKIKSDQDIILSDHKTESSAIKHVFYIIKENRTYDQIFGDLPQGNGDTSICIFGEKTTPNQHKLAKEYTLFDNFYADAEVSADGHNWSTAAYATDYVEKTWPVLYSKRGGSYDFEGGVPIASPSSGYIWHNVLKNNKTFRNYGEFVDQVKDRDSNYVVRDAYLVGFTNRQYPGFDMKISDLYRYSIWEKEFDKFVKSENIPNLSLIRLPNDHTSGTWKGNLTPEAYVGQNDLALGKIVDKISHSSIWKESIILVLEDDAQAGSDHVDAHRSVLMAISPYIKKNFVDHTMYSTSGVLKTIELILGIPPMTQYDLAAIPLVNAITSKMDTTSYNVVEPLIDIEKKNMADAYGSERSRQFDFTAEDSAPDIELNEIIWKSIKGKDSQMPAPVRSAFVRTISNQDDDD